MLTDKPSTNDTTTTHYPNAFFLIFIIAGLIGNYFPFSLLNAHFIFGSIFAMLALQFLSYGRGVVAAAIISGYTYLAWNHPWAILTMTSEAVVVGWLIHRKKISLVTADALYWFFIGIPIGYICFVFISHLPASNATFLITKQGINGIANALIARLIFTVLSHWWIGEYVSFRETVSNLLIFFAACPFLILLTLSGRTDLAETDRQIRETLIQDNRRITVNIENWIQERKQAVVTLAGIAETQPPDQMQERLEQTHESDGNFLRIALIDKEATVIAYSPPLDELGRSNIGKSFADRPYLPVLKSNREPMLSEVLVSRFGRPDPVAIMLAPVISGGKYLGAVAGILNFQRIQDIFTTSAFTPETRFTLLDRNGLVIMTNRDDHRAMMPFTRPMGTISPIGETILQWIPELPANTSTIELWGKSFYIAEADIGKLAEWRIILEQPVAPFQKLLYNRYTVRFFLIFAILLAALVLAELLSRFLFSATEKLGRMTLDLPVRLSSGSPIDWPQSAILETNSLIVNFRNMADSLKAQFSRNLQINESLERRIEERTRELRESEDRYRNLIMHSPDAVLVNLENRIILVNYTCLKLFGCQNEDELIGKTPYELFHPDFHDQIRERIHRLQNLGEAVPRIEEKIVRMNGELIDVEVLAAPFPFGGVNAIHVILRDITEQKKAREERERMLAAIEQAGEIIIITDPDGIINYVNPAFESVLGYTREEVMKRLPRILKSGKQDKDFYRNLWETITSKQTWAGRMVNKTKGGKLITVESSISPVCDASGKIVNFVAVMHDITENLRLSEQFHQAQKMESIGHLAGGVAHDFNNMLGIILGHAEMALDQVAPSQPLYNDLLEIRQAAERSASLTRQLLAFARKQIIDPKVLDLNETVEGMLKMLRRLIGEDIALAWLPSPGLWPIRMDPSQIDQLLANLCINARDAITDIGKVTIETGNISFDEAYCRNHLGFVVGEFVQLAVSDNGCGMNKDTQDKLFEPFFTTKEMGKGTGLGLATVYGIVKQNNGFINVYSELNQGTTFKIYLPRHAGHVVTNLQPVAENMISGSGETILLVEDEPAILKMTTTMLTMQGYTVLSANTPDEAMRLAKEHTGEIHLLMTDVVMPEMNGRALAKYLLSLYPGIRLLFTSGYTANVIAHHGVLDNGVHFIQKPFSMKALTEAVQNALKYSLNC